jgi:hypothetical protein
MRIIKPWYGQRRWIIDLYWRGNGHAVLIPTRHFVLAYFAFVE